MDRGILEQENLIESYVEGLVRLNKTLDEQKMNGIHEQLIRQMVHRRYNRDTCRLDKMSTGPFAEVEYRSGNMPTSISEEVISGMADLPWLETYGLNFRQIMELPYDQWRDMHARLRKLTEEKPLSPQENLVKIQSETLSKMDQLSESILLLVRSFMGNKGKRRNDVKRVRTPPPSSS